VDYECWRGLLGSIAILGPCSSYFTMIRDVSDPGLSMWDEMYISKLEGRAGGLR
jgi:hypothetical protein